MKAILTVIFLTITCVAFGQEAAEPADKIGSFMAQWYWVVGGLFVIWEYLVGESKVKSNSTIALIINAIKMMKPKK